MKIFKNFIAITFMFLLSFVFLSSDSLARDGTSVHNFDTSIDVEQSSDISTDNVSALLVTKEKLLTAKSQVYDESRFERRKHLQTSNYSFMYVPPIEQIPINRERRFNQFTTNIRDVPNS